MNKKGEWGFQQVISLMLVILVVLSVLMFFYQDNLLDYLRQIPGYELPDSEIKDGGTGTVVEGDGSCGTERVAIQGQVDESLLERMLPWNSVESPVYINLGGNKYLDLELSLIDSKDLEIVIKGISFPIGEVKDIEGEEKLMIIEDLFDINSQLQRTLRFQALIDGEKNIEAFQIRTIQELSKLQGAVLEPSISNGIITDFCGSDSEQIINIDRWPDNVEGIETIKFDTLTGLKANSQTITKSSWFGFVKKTEIVLTIEIPQLENIGFDSTEFNLKAYFEEDQDYYVEGFRSILLVSQGTKHVGVFYPDGSFWLERRQVEISGGKRSPLFSQDSELRVDDDFYTIHLFGKASAGGNTYYSTLGGVGSNPIVCYESISELTKEVLPSTYSFDVPRIYCETNINIGDTFDDLINVAPKGLR